MTGNRCNAGKVKNCSVKDKFVVNISSDNGQKRFVTYEAYYLRSGVVILNENVVNEPLVHIVTLIVETYLNVQSRISSKTCKYFFPRAVVRLFFRRETLIENIIRSAAVG